MNISKLCIHNGYCVTLANYYFLDNEQETCSYRDETSSYKNFHYTTHKAQGPKKTDFHTPSLPFFHLVCFARGTEFCQGYVINACLFTNFDQVFILSLIVYF